ncbi:hypothetical protein A4G19_14315 [Pasteurellaceae bacterium Macca]|nr:hypothetical protein [Pasteurellaceae bacterium Macca]
MTLTEKQTENTSTATQAFTLEMTTANGLTRYYSKEDLIECGIFGSKTSIDRYVAMGKLKKIKLGVLFAFQRKPWRSLSNNATR